jgi:hypothetical protein
MTSTRKTIHGSTSSHNKKICISMKCSNNYLFK